MCRKIQFPFALFLCLSVNLHGGAVGAKDSAYKADAPEKTKAEKRFSWPAYDVKISGLTDDNRSEVKSALFKMGNIDEVSFREGDVAHITVKNAQKPVWFASLKAELTKVPGVDVKSFNGMEAWESPKAGNAESPKTNDSERPKEANRQIWPLYRVQLDGLTEDRKDELKAAFLKIQNVDSVSVKADGVVYVIAKDENKPIWYLQLKAAIAQVPGVTLKSWKGIDENEGSGAKTTEPAKPKPKPKPKAVARSAWPYYRFQITGFDASRWHEIKSALIKVENVSEVSGKKGGVVYLTVKDEQQPLKDSEVNAVVSQLHGLGVKDFKGCAERE